LPLPFTAWHDLHHFAVTFYQLARPAAFLPLPFTNWHDPPRFCHRLLSTGTTCRDFAIAFYQLA